MARPQKDGLDYFPFDVDFMKDTKVRRIARTFGCTGTMAIVMLFTDIYRTRGYYMNWDEDTCFDLSETLQCEPYLPPSDRAVCRIPEHRARRVRSGLRRVLWRCRETGRQCRGARDCRGR